MNLSPTVQVQVNATGTTYSRLVPGLPRWVLVQNYLTFGQLFYQDTFMGGWRDCFGYNSMSLQAYSSVAPSFEYELSVQNLSSNELAHFGPSPSSFQSLFGVSFFAEEWDFRNTNGVYQAADQFDVQITAYFPDKTSALAHMAGSATTSQRKRMQRGASLSNWPEYAGLDHRRTGHGQSLRASHGQPRAFVRGH